MNNTYVAGLGNRGPALDVTGPAREISNMQWLICTNGPWKKLSAEDKIVISDNDSCVHIVESNGRHHLWYVTQEGPDIWWESYQLDEKIMDIIKRFIEEREKKGWLVMEINEKDKEAIEEMTKIDPRLAQEWYVRDRIRRILLYGKPRWEA